MANPFLQSSARLVARNGVQVEYLFSNRVVDDINGTADTVTGSYPCIMYPKQIQANQFNFPNLIDKEAIMFYLANNALAFTVKVGDNIKYRDTNYRILSYQEHIAAGQVCLYRIVGVKS